VAGSESEHAGLGVFGLVYRISFSQRESSFHFFSLVSRPGSKVLGSELWIGLKMLQLIDAGLRAGYSRYVSREGHYVCIYIFYAACLFECLNRCGSEYCAKGRITLNV
jgi:hypothetical protein